MFHVISGLIALYVICRVVYPLSCSRPIKWLLAIVIVLVSQHHLITRTFFGSMASPEVPSYVLMGLGWGFGSLIFTAVLLVVADILGLLTYLLKKTVGRKLLHAGPPLAIVAMALAAIAVWQAVRVPDVHRVEIELSRLPAEFDGYRLVQLSDLHASSLLQHDWMEAVVAKVNALEPDLILLTGDMVDGTVDNRRDDVAPLRELSAPQGVLAIPGNHEYYSGYQQWLQHFDELGLRLLLNEHVTLTRGAASITVAGLTDPVAERTDMPLPDIDSALSGVDDETVVILLNHRPDGAERYAQAGADLQLSGHTHGGQFLGFHWIVQQANDGFVSRLYQVADMQLYVSNGAGLWNGFPIRLGVPSEITEITLRSADRQ